MKPVERVARGFGRAGLRAGGRRAARRRRSSRALAAKLKVGERCHDRARSADAPGRRRSSGCAIRWRRRSRRAERCVRRRWCDERASAGAELERREIEARSRAPEIDGRRCAGWRSARSCAATTCGIEYPEPEPQLFNFNRPLGACPECEGFGNIVATDMDRVVPDPPKSIREGAIAPWNTPAYAHELEELLALADDYNLPVDVPFAELTEARAADRRRGRAGAQLRRAARVSSAGWSGGSTRCTCGCF